MSQQTSLGRFFGPAKEGAPNSALSDVKRAEAKKRPKNRRLEDEEEPAMKSKASKRGSSKVATVVLSSDSDSDDLVPSRPHHTNGDNPLLKAPKAKKAKVRLTPEKTKKTVTASEFFGEPSGKEGKRKGKAAEEAPKTSRGAEEDVPADLLPSGSQRRSPRKKDKPSVSKPTPEKPSKEKPAKSSPRAKEERVEDSPPPKPKERKKAKREAEPIPETPEPTPSPNDYTIEETESESRDELPVEPRKKVTTPGKGAKSPRAAKSPKTPALTDDELKEKRRQSVQGYQSYLHREGPDALGSKPLPEGDEDCLAGLKFLVTGVLHSIERETAHDLVKKHGGHVVTSLSKKTSYVILGRDSGPTKLKKIEDFKLKTLDEDAFFDLIRQRSKGKGKGDSAKEAHGSPPPKHKAPAKKAQLSSAPAKEEPKASSASSGSGGKRRSYEAWVDKYKPQSVKDIVGQQGDRSAVRKLEAWLRSWAKWQGPHAEKKAPWNSQDGADKRAALLSGPPGIGKTTAAHLVAKSLGLTVLELNASDTRKATQLREWVAPKVSNTSMDFFATKAGRDEAEKPHPLGIRQVLVMDEVDGMAGNEDRAGISELIQMIKTAKFPIICICNDRQCQKIRTLSNYTFDLRFNKPRVESLRSRVLSIASQEGVKLGAPAADQLIEGANCDIRQVIQHLQLLAADTVALDFDQAKAAAAGAKKDVAVSLFEAGRELVSGPRSSGWMAKKTELFFSDYSLMPLFVQENYPHLRLKAPQTKAKDLAALARAAESIALGDRADALLRSTQSWSLLNTQCAAGALLPLGHMDGYLGGQLVFPSWLGRNSTQNKRRRQLTSLQHHMALVVSSSESSLATDYLPVLRDSLTRPLRTEQEKGAAAVRDVMVAYALGKEDSEAVAEIATFGGRDPLQGVLPKVLPSSTSTSHHPKMSLSETKAALTRLLNAKEGGLVLPYATEAGVKGKKRKTTAGEDGEEEEEEEAEVDPDAFRVKSGGSKGKKKEPAASKGKKKK